MVRFGWGRSEVRDQRVLVKNGAAYMKHRNDWLVSATTCLSPSPFNFPKAVVGQLGYVLN
jgi:hypothetical protein